MPIFEVNAENGLSPLARGTQQNGEDFAQKLRFIPAGAGNTAVNAMIILRPAVYPRWRGEHVVWPEKVGFKCGLSPLARGTRLCTHMNPSPTAVYPRWRGEHNAENVRPKRWPGLSPLARGTREVECC